MFPEVGTQDGGGMGDLFLAQETLVNHPHREAGPMPGPVLGVGQPLVGVLQADPCLVLYLE